MKTGSHPMKVRLKLFFNWGIFFGEPYEVMKDSIRKVAYAEKQDIINAILEKFAPEPEQENTPPSKPVATGGQALTESRMHEPQTKKSSRAVRSTPLAKREIAAQEGTDGKA